jgi:endonuclease/exonuclease/phosphatase family metal-dependent hydrolase
VFLLGPRWDGGWLGQNEPAMRITSLNLRGFFEWEKRSERIVAYLRRVDPDVLLFQEVVYLPAISPFSPVELLNRELGYPYRHESITRLQRGRTFNDYREGLAALSRWPVPASEAVVLHHEDHDPHQRIVQFLDVQQDGRLWPLANVHLSVRDDFAIEHLKEVLEMLNAKEERRILGGDFNVDHLERHAALWRGRAVLTSELEPYLSRPASHENDDYFLVPTEYTVESLQLSGDELSDHRALTVDVRAAG